MANRGGFMVKKIKESTLVRTHKDEIKEELKNNSIVLSFAVAIVIIGFFSIFYDAGTGLLIGVALSAILLSIIQCFSNGNTMLNILPIFTILLFGFFEKFILKIPVVNLLLNNHMQYFIIFLAFSLAFIIQAYKNVLYKHQLKKDKLDANNNKNKMMLAQLSTDIKLVNLANRIKKVSEDRGIFDTQVDRAVNDLLDYIESESFIANIKSSLILKGEEENKTEFNIEEIEEAILMSRGIDTEDTLKEKTNNDVSLDETEPEEDPFDFDFKFD